MTGHVHPTRATWVQAASIPAEEAGRLLGGQLRHEYSLAELLMRPEVEFGQIESLAGLCRPDAGVSRETLTQELGVSMADAVIEQVQIGIKYAGYIAKQNRDVERSQQFEDMTLPDNFDYSRVPALSFEVRQKLNVHQPLTLGQAARLSGITPAAISLLLVFLKKRHLTTSSQESSHERIVDVH